MNDFYQLNISDKSISGPIKLNKLPIETDKPNPSIGISDMSWSFDSNFLATKNGNSYNLLQIKLY